MIKSFKERIPKLWLILKCLAIGYIAGSIQAPFGLEWRKEDALPPGLTAMDQMMRILPLPVNQMDVEAIDDEGIR